MRSVQRVCRVVAPFLGVAMFIGCDDSKPSVANSTTEATVKGVVKVDGKLVTDGELIFDPSNYQRPLPARSTPIGKDGHYQIKTVVGSNTIKMVGPATRKSPILQTVSRSLEVKDGENTFDFEAKSD